LNIYGKKRKISTLVHKRKGCRLCSSITNPAKVENGRYDSNEIGPWSLWQGNLNAELLIVGQDWGDTSYFKRWQGWDQPSKNPTNENLQNLIAHIGIIIAKPRESQAHIVFFTNLILCLKQKGGLSGKVKMG
jgi:DNA polymerase